MSRPQEDEVSSGPEDDQESHGLLSNRVGNKYSGSNSDLLRSSNSTSSASGNNGITWYFAVFLIVNAALGAGLLNFAKAFDNAGGILVSSLVQLVAKYLYFFRLLISIYSI